MQWNYELTATSYSNHTINNTIYDDYNFPEIVPPDDSPVYWNCQQQMLITTYTAPDDSVSLVFNANSSAPPCYLFSTCTSGSGICCRDYYIYKGLSATPALIYTQLGVIDGDTVKLANSSQDLYTIKVYAHGADTSTASLLTGYVILLPKVKRLWIDASPVCSGVQPAGTFYNFQVMADPAISTIMNIPGGLGQAVLSPFTPIHGPSCGEYGSDIEAYILQFYFNAIDNNPASPLHYDVLSPPPSSPPYINNAQLDNDFGIDATNYYINYGELDPNLSSTGSEWGYTPTINVTYTDCTGATLSASAPIIIESSALPATASINPTATPGSGIVGPPNAVGVPQPSYDIYDYNVSGTETWTPTNNPIANMHGDGDTVSIIRVQNNITITAGNTLSINNMTVEFGPGADVTVIPPPDSMIHGGTLLLDHATLTAYRGCDGTDESTWAGVRIEGDTAFPEVNGPVHCQGQVTMENSTISYADIGVQNGTSPSNSGGIILATSCQFYNNATSLSLLPYTHTYALAEIENDTFLIDPALWFVPTTPTIQITGTHVTSFSGNTLTNATGGTIPEGIYCTDAGIAIDHTTISNFNSGILCTTIGAAKTITVGGCTFNNNQFGIYSTGLIAQNIVNNIFNIPYSSSTGGVFYTGSTVLAVFDQNAGALMNASTGYNLSNNIFQTNATTSSAPPYGYYNYTTGTLEYNTGSDDNEVVGNTFTGLGVAMLSNFVNNTGSGSPYGLQYLCNTDTRVGDDIAALGDYAPDGGINPYQGTSTGSGIYNLPAGNIFGAVGGGWNIYNQQIPLYYNFNGAPFTSNPQYPANVTSGVTPEDYGTAADCYFFIGTGPYSISGITGNPDYSTSDIAYRVATANVNYYMNDTIPHRDSLYYWAGQMGTAYGDLLTTTMLIEDNLIDSANTVYNNITTKYSLDSIEANDFARGRSLMDVVIAKREGDRNILSLTDAQIATLRSVKASTTMWAHARAEGWLYLINGEPFTDTLLYPAATESTDTTGDGGRLSNPNKNPAPLANQSQLNNSVYPNPVHDFLQVMYTAKTTDDITIQIEDISGRTVITQSLQSGVQTPVDMTALVPGMYLYRIFEGVNVTMIGKIAKD